MDPAASSGIPDVPASSPADRLDSWKEIAAYLKRSVRTAHRWEKHEGLPVHRHEHKELGSVFAYKSELDAWFDTRCPQPESPEDREQQGGRPGQGAVEARHPYPVFRRRGGKRLKRMMCQKAATPSRHPIFLPSS